MFELRFRGGRFFGDEFDGGVGSGIARMVRAAVGEEDRGIGRDAEKFAERKAAVCELAEKMLSCS